MLLGVGILVGTGRINLPLFRLLPLPPQVSAKDFSFMADDQLKQHFVAQVNARSFRVIQAAGDGSAETIRSEYERTPGGIRAHVTVTGTGTSANEFIYADSRLYVKDPLDNSWWTQQISPDDTDRTGVTLKDPKTEYLAKQNLQYQSNGEEACGKDTCVKYTETNPQNQLIQRTFWFDKRSRLLRREELSFGGITTLYTYEYDGVRVDTPKETKTIAEGASIFDYVLAAGSAGLTASGSAQLDPSAVARQLQEELRKQLQDQLQQELQDQFQQQLRDQLQQQLNALPPIDVPATGGAELASPTPTP